MGSSDQLTAPPPGQRLLFSAEIEEVVTQKEEREGIYTGERFKVRRPAAYQAALQLLGAGIGMLKIGSWLGVHHLTIAAVRDREKEAIDMASQTLGKLDTAITLLLDRLLEHPGLVPMAQIGMVIDQLIRNRELLAGRATSRTETYERIDVHGDWETILGQLISEKELPAGSVLEIEAGNRFAGGENPPIDPADQAAGEAADPVPAEARADVESDAHPGEADPNPATNAATSLPFDLDSLPSGAAGPGATAAGRGGGRSIAAGLDDSMYQAGQEFSSNYESPPSTD